MFGAPLHFFELDGTALAEVAAPPNAPNESSYTENLMLLPTGEVLATDLTADVELYTPASAPAVAAAAPVITSIPVPAAAAAGLDPVTTLHPGQRYTVDAARMDGLSEAVAFTTANPATNYPLVRITNLATRHVRYARTSGHSTRAIGPDVHGTTELALPADLEPGPSTIEVVANAIASPAVAIDVK